ncbi:MAG: alpha/beta hydrolase family protein [Bilophila wadsworthia]
MTRRFLFFLLAFLILTCTAYAAPLQPGCKTLGIWEPAENVRLDVAVWYPSRSAPFQVNYGDWNSPPHAAGLRGRKTPSHPALHDSAGSRFSLHELASELARNGFVVLAFTHPGDNVDDMGALFMPVQVTDRAKQLTQALDIALADPETAPLIDPDRIGVLGVGPGGTAAMLIAGARLDATGWPIYCAGKEENADPYCTPWARQRMGAFSTTPNLSAPYRDRRVRAAAAVSPSYAMMFTPASLSRIRIPLLLLRAERTPLYTLQHAERLLSAMPQPPQLGVLPDADTASLMSSCGGNLDQTLPEMCLAVSPSRRKAVQAKMAAESAAFFLKYLGTPNPPPLPPEPRTIPKSHHIRHAGKERGPQEEAVEIRRWTKTSAAVASEKGTATE